MEAVTLVFHVEEQDSGNRLDKYVPIQIQTEREDFSRSATVMLIEEGHVSVNGTVVSKHYKLRQGDCVTVVLPKVRPLDVVAEAIPLEIPYEDEDLLVVNKPQGMVVHPAPGNENGTLVNALLAHCGNSLSGINGVARPGIVHRIDKNTSGLLIVAKTDRAHVGLAEQIKEHSFLRVYHGIVHGHFREPQGTVNAPIGRHPTDRKKMTVTEKNAKNAVTHYRVLEELARHTYTEFQLETGRTHQIRVHMSAMGHAILGDDVYSPKDADSMGLLGQTLHAKKIGFLHPVTQQYLEFDSELPVYFTEILEKLRKMT